ncbi:transposase family protein [Kalymmatonema gypsitolerans NIES-4073]|nr:transposase family protein [Scytonema sp. NIES-4073]
MCDCAERRRLKAYRNSRKNSVNQKDLKVTRKSALFHFSRYLQVPSNIILLFQLPHTPEVNPIERFWEEIKKRLSWECFQTLNELREAVWKQLDKFTPSQIKSIAGWSFILEALFVSGFS